jgi:DNA polymerase-1
VARVRFSARHPGADTGFHLLRAAADRPLAGGGEDGLAQRLGVDVGEAKDIMDRYFGAFPGLRDFMEASIADAKRLGFTKTELGRIRPLPELYSENRNIRMAAERQAMNAGIQGLAADLFKVALIRLDDALTQASLEARLVLQVHDEVIVEAPEAEQAQVEAITREALGSAGNLKVPLAVSLGWGQSWGSAKG